MNPFGAGSTRFEYQQQPSKKSELSPDINNGMISVKDKEMMEKRFAFQKTIELHRKMQDMKPNANFQSRVKRSCSPILEETTFAGDAEAKYNSHKDSFNNTMRTMASDKKSMSIPGRSSFGLFNENQAPYESTTNTRIGQDQGYAMLLKDHFSKPGFNATTARFNYAKQQNEMAEVPGPGAYERFKTVEGNRKGVMENEDYDRSVRMTGKTNTAVFKNPTTRDDYLSYLASEKKKPKDVSPDKYFRETRPFLKKSFNASLPPPRFM